MHLRTELHAEKDSYLYKASGCGSGPEVTTRASIQGLTTSRRIRYGHVDIEWRLAAEASTRVIATVHDFSLFSDHSALTGASDYVSEQTCTTEAQLSAALSQRTESKYWVNICSQPPLTAGGPYSALTMEAAFRLLHRHCGLQPFSVLDAMNNTHRLKLDKNASSIYCSMMCFLIKENLVSDSLAQKSPGLKLKSFSGTRKSSTLRRVFRTIKEPLLPTRSSQIHHEAPGNKSFGTIHELVHCGLPPKEIERWRDKSGRSSSVHWQRSCFFLTESCLISVFREPMGSTKITQEVQNIFDNPELHFEELGKSPAFLFYKLIESVVQQMEAVMLSYRSELMSCQANAFAQVRPHQLKNMEQSQQLFLMQQELRVIHQHFDHSRHVLGALLLLVKSSTSVPLPLRAMSGRPYSNHDIHQSGNGNTLLQVKEAWDHTHEPCTSTPSTPTGFEHSLLNDESVIFLEEVQDDIQARMHENEEVLIGCKELMEFIESRATYRTSVSQQIQAGVVTVLLPLICFIGIYGTDIEKHSKHTPLDHPFEYMFMWSSILIMASLAVVTLWRLRAL